MTALRLALTIGELFLAGAALALLHRHLVGTREVFSGGLILLHAPACCLPPAGFANRLARRMAMHNGYRTLGESSTLAQVGPANVGSAGAAASAARTALLALPTRPAPASLHGTPPSRPAPPRPQLHPSCARVAADEDGLLPEWLVYHELVQTGRVYLSKVRSVQIVGGIGREGRPAGDRWEPHSRRELDESGPCAPPAPAGVRGGRRLGAGNPAAPGEHRREPAQVRLRVWGVGL